MMVPTMMATFWLLLRPCDGVGALEGVDEDLDVDVEDDEDLDVDVVVDEDLDVEVVDDEEVDVDDVADVELEVDVVVDVEEEVDVEVVGELVSVVEVGVVLCTIPVWMAGMVGIWIEVSTLT